MDRALLTLYAIALLSNTAVLFSIAAGIWKRNRMIRDAARFAQQQSERIVKETISTLRAQAAAHAADREAGRVDA